MDSLLFTGPHLEAISISSASFLIKEPTQRLRIRWVNVMHTCYFYVWCLTLVISFRFPQWSPKDEMTPLMYAEIRDIMFTDNLESFKTDLLKSLLTTAAKWRRRRVSAWLSSELSGGDNILSRLPSDVARICGSYLWFGTLIPLKWAAFGVVTVLLLVDVLLWRERSQ